MRLARIKTASGIHQVAFKDGNWHAVRDIFDSPLQYTGESFAEKDCSFLSPVEPRVIFAMAHNGTPDQINNPPQAFQKSTHTLSGPGDPIYRDASLGQMDVECELTAVISKTARHLTLENAMDHVLGFTIGNDVTLPEQTPHDHLLLQTKNGDGFTPLGPWIETDFAQHDDATMYVRVNGKQVIQSSTNQLARGVAAQLVYVTKYTTLGRGDILLGGSPTSMYAVNAGDQVEIEIEGIGVLANPVVAS